MEPEAKFRRFTEVETLVRALNDRGFGTVEDRFFLKVEGDCPTDQHFLVERKEAARWIDGFLASTSPLMLLLGESGLGKSCFLYMIATKPRDNLVVSFFAGATLVGASDLFGRISTEFSVAPEKIKALFRHLDGLLSRETAGKIIPSAMRGLFSGDDARAHRCIQLLLSLGREHLPEIVAKSREHLQAVIAMDERTAKGLVNLYVLFFCAAGRNEDSVRALQEAGASFIEPVLDFPNFRDVVTAVLKETIQRWGPYLFSTTSRNGENPFSYP